MRVKLNILIIMRPSSISKTYFSNNFSFMVEAAAVFFYLSFFIFHLDVLVPTCRVFIFLICDCFVFQLLRPI